MSRASTSSDCAAPGCALESNADHVVFRAGTQTGLVTVCVEAVAGERRASAEARIEITEEADVSDNQTGIPQPEFIHEPTGDWRSRLRQGRWEVNAGHRDYLMATEGTRRKLRYLAALLAKEIVLHSFPHPQHAGILERMVGVLAITDRRLER